MKISEHADRTERQFGLRAEEIHLWIDGFFDHSGREHRETIATDVDFDPYSHRRFRHCKEALSEAIKEFGDKYTNQQIKDVFEAHIRDDYHGYLPSRVDFENNSFTAKYHDIDSEDDLAKVLDESELAEYFDGVNQEEDQGSSGFSRFNLRIILPTVCAVLLFITAILYVILPLVEGAMVGQKKQMLKELTATAVSIVDSYVDKERQGELTTLEAQSQAINEIKSLRYGPENKDYFFITDMHPTMVMHPYRDDLTHQDLTDYQADNEGSSVAIFVELTKLVRQFDQGFLEYQWQWKDDPTITAPKMTYVQGVGAWLWVVGTGVYLEDVQHELSKLEKTLFRIFLAITLGLVAIMLYVITQSKAIEKKRKRAELALHEAKNRYKALVESSNEGYILEADGKIIFSNNRLHRLLGYTDTELKASSIWASLFSESPANERVLEHLNRLFSHETEPSEFEAQIVTKSGREIDIILSTSRIFLSEKLGHVISFRPIVRKVYGGGFASVNPLTDYQKTSFSIVADIERGESQSHVVESLNRLTDLIREMISSGTRPDHLRQLIGTTYDAAICRFIELAIDELGEPPVPFAFLSFGSNARHDMTLFSDQDNAIVFEAPDDKDLKATRRYFLHLAERVCAMLDQAGYSYCDGLIMASNHQWCLSEKEWRHNFSQWIEQASSEPILELNVFFDIRATYGEASLVDSIQSHIQHEIELNPTFLTTYAQHCLSHAVPNIEEADKDVTINIKECLRPIELFGRLYALKLDIRHSNTLARLGGMLTANQIDSETYREMAFIFDHLWRLRFMNQIVEYSDLRQVNDELALNQLSVIEQQQLDAVLQRMNLFRHMIGEDFALPTL
ncbi:PAS domain S-box protein [Vibrio aquaticus]|uniref:PAS domain S-box protein n=1 Tax=Vibrio aquaticus TaxID=2496559 RepID=A0A432D0W2_9VIBR|nr:DUF294 nucleotidyltransferase-like domain-containing protein [Vibrio aquaticus]RTZ17536.1 PAS domain S-box protein [Vibrio aquaticus]